MSLSPLKLIFMGTPAFAVPTLASLLQTGHKVIGVYSQPPRPAGRGHKIQKSAVHLFAEDHGLPVYTPLSLQNKEIQQALVSLQPDAIIVAAYGLILPREVLDIPVHGCFNVHASLLPRWRGAAPIQRALLAGDTVTGITIMQMEAGLDTGPMLLKGTMPITETATVLSLQSALANKGGTLMTEALSLLQTGSLNPVVQPMEGVTHAAKIKKQEGQLDWSLPATVLHRHIRALNPWPGAWGIIQGQRLKVLSADIKEMQSGAAPGTILDLNFTIQCGENALQISSVQRSSSGPIQGQEFLRGHPSVIGQCFEKITPFE